jgi:hypothetical protein
MQVCVCVVSPLAVSPTLPLCVCECLSGCLLSLCLIFSLPFCVSCSLASPPPSPSRSTHESTPGAETFVKVRTNPPRPLSPSASL